MPLARPHGRRRPHGVQFPSVRNGEHAVDRWQGLEPLLRVAS